MRRHRLHMRVALTSDCTLVHQEAGVKTVWLKTTTLTLLIHIAAGPWLP